MSNQIELLTILAIAVVCVWLFRHLKLPAILAYLVAGVVVGEHGLSWVAGNVDYEHFAELGIVFLLFTLGLEFSLPKLMAMRHLVIGVGSLQVVISTAIFMIVAMIFGINLAGAFVIGGVIALSSTAIVIKQLSDTGEVKTKSGQLSVAVLLFQDVAVVPFLIIIPLLSLGNDVSMFYALLMALIKGVVVVGLLLIIGKRVLPKLFNLVAQVRTDELFVLTTLLVTLMASGLTQMFGLSMALGAFLAGMMLGESQYKYQLEADIRPYRDILLGLFFVTVGMKLDIGLVLSSPLTIFSVLLAFMAIKVVVVALLALRMGEGKKDAIASGIMLAQMGEFGFVLIALAGQYNVLDNNAASILLGAGVISMAMTPYMISNAKRWSVKCLKKEPLINQELSNPETNKISEGLKDHVIICGFGRVGQTVSRFLKQEDIDYVAIDIDPLRVKESRDAGQNVIFGSSRQTELLAAAKIHRARLVVVAFGEDSQSKEVIEKIRTLSDDVPILVRTRNDEALVSLKAAGANEVVPEILEGSLMLVSQVLALSGVPFSRVVRRVQNERKNHYNHLHGFYQGEHTDLSPDKIEKLEFAHAVLLAESSYSTGKTIDSLQLDKRRVTIISMQRDGVETEFPSNNLVLQAQDTLVLRGKPRRVERAERYLQEGV